MSLYLLIQLFYKAPNFIISINCSFFPICHQLFIFFINTCMYLCLVTQSCSIPFNPIDCSPPGSSVHAILQARILEWVLSRFSHVWPFATPRTAALQAPLSVGFSMQEYWSGLPFPPHRIFPTQGLLSSLLNCFQADSLLSEPLNSLTKGKNSQEGQKSKHKLHAAYKTCI